MPPTDSLAEEYPEAAPYIGRAVAEHGEEWVLDHYYPKLSQLGVVMAVPEKEELPFFDPEEHEAMGERERREAAEALRAYRENLKSGTRPGEESDDEA